MKTKLLDLLNLLHLLHLPLIFPLLLLAVSFCEPVKGQAQPVAPDCQIFISFSTAGTTANFDNRFVGCVTWTLQYASSGFTGLMLTFQSADGASTPGTFGAYAGSTVTGANPMSSTTGETSTFSNGTVTTPWLNVKLSGLSGTGSVSGIVYGYKSGPVSGGSAPSSGCAGTASTPCIVAGPDASGASPTKNPVFIAGEDGGTHLISPIETANGGQVQVNVTNFNTDANGSLIAGAYPSHNVITLTTSGLTRIITGSAGETITIGAISISFATAITFQLEYGTGTNCGTGTTAITGVYQSVAAIALDSPITLPAMGVDVCVNMGSSVNGGGIVTYEQQVI